MTLPPGHPFAGLPARAAGAVLCDPPWGFQTWSGPEKKVASRGTVAPYKTMEMTDMCALPVADLCAADCVIFMWSVWCNLPDSLRLIDAWGFTYKNSAFDWMKADISQMDIFRDDADARCGLGYWTRTSTEPCLLATRGKPKRLNADVRQGIIEPIREHSRKPDCVHDRIERLVAGPYLELFARQSRPGWTTWGNEATKFDTPAMEAAE